jgi:hypothetical protein
MFPLWQNQEFLREKELLKPCFVTPIEQLQIEQYTPRSQIRKSNKITHNRKNHAKFMTQRNTEHMKCVERPCFI